MCGLSAAGETCATVPHATILGGGAVYNYEVTTATFTDCRCEAHLRLCRRMICCVRDWRIALCLPHHPVTRGAGM